MSLQKFRETSFLIQEANKEVRCHCRMNMDSDPPELQIELALGETGDRRIVIADQELTFTIQALQAAQQFLEPSDQDVDFVEEPEIYE